MLRIRRVRGLGCLGCLPLGGLLPLIAIGALIYWLVNRRAPGATPPLQRTPPPAHPNLPDAHFCASCGKPVSAGEKFCRGCGAPI